MIGIDLTGKIAVVTGGSGNLGRVICRTLARCGADVCVHYNGSREKAERVAEEICGMGRRAMAAQADVGELFSVLHMRDQVAETLGMPDIIVNNAVAQYKWTSVLEQEIADFDSQYRSCVLHNVNMAKAFVPHMRERRWGRVVAINTERAMQDIPGAGAYVAGKRGQDGVLRALCAEVAAGNVTVNQVAPGWMRTEDWRDDPEREDDADYIRRVPMGRRGDDQDIANAVAFLCSDLAGFITGAILPVAGGYAMSKL
jgi:3-oxoacyl-[acyl-carrier protein] reductase